VETFDGKSFMAFPHHTDGNALDNWWGAVARGWEKDSLKTIRTLLSHRCVVAVRVARGSGGGCWR
jgi:hypothetical protein